MDQFVTHSGVAVPLGRTNVNTDDIVPARFLKTVRRDGFADALFANWRYLDNTRAPDPDFVLNQPAYRGATILVAGENFGCGSSREHAPWSLHEYGFRSVIAPSFGDIFYNNCFNSGLLPIVLDAAAVEAILGVLGGQQRHVLHIDLPAQTVTLPDQRTFTFDVDAFKKDALLQGLDNVGWTLSHADEVAAYEQRRGKEVPWLFPQTAAN